MRVASVAAGVLLAHVGDGGAGMRRLDLERGDERVLGLDRHLVRLVADLDPDRVPQGHSRSLLRPGALLRVNVDAARPKRTTNGYPIRLFSGSGVLGVRA